MKIFIDTANVEEIRRMNDLGIIDGVTTNPSLIAREKKKFKDLVTEITGIADFPISVEAVSTQADAMIKEAKEIASIAPNVVVKIPMIEEGLKATKILARDGVKTNVTLVFSTNQALLAAKAGATYVSPFIGRLDDLGHEGMQIIRDIIQIYQNYGYRTEVIVASIRHPLHVIDAAKIGAHVATIPPDVLRKMIGHPLTDIGLKRFLDDWKKVQSMQ
ncbi:fructose-6-phosphate aldolase [Candidatus Bathyarchaeota archaeon]|jgi:transaldolase|nr:fructose-6-phosphate aldolase [Candidatus Bathyarchaeota archaeon]